jgi:RNA polymerase sigma-70 factor (ECF subfamily)
MPDAPQTAEFVRLWMLHGRSIYAYLLTLASNYADADELYQDVGTTLWEKFDEFTPGTSFPAWARQVARYKVQNFWKLHRHKTVLCSPEFLDTISKRYSQQTDVLGAQQKAFADCYNKLPPRQKDLIRRRYESGVTPTGIAEQTGRSVKAVYHSLRRIHNALFDCVRKATVGEGAS